MIKTVTMGDLGTIITGNTPPRSRPELYGSHTPFVKATDISENEKYTYNPEEGYSEEGYKKYIKSLVPKGSTCVVTIGSWQKDDNGSLRFIYKSSNECYYTFSQF